jgi:transcriptional regulator with XRE-family HTH domain
MTSVLERSFGERLRALRLQRAMTQRELAERASVSETTIVRLEASSTAVRPSTVKKLARALGVPVLVLTTPDAS